MKIDKLYIIVLLFFSNFILGQTQGPNNGSTFSNVAIAGSTSSWNNTNNVASSNNSYAICASDLATNGNYSDYLQITNFNFSIPSGKQIDGIVVEMECFDNGTASKARDYSVRIVKNGTISTTDKAALNWPSTDGVYITYGGSTDLWGETWSDTDINSSDFGFAISAKRQGGGGSTCYPAIDHIRIIIYYSTSLPIELISFNGVPEANKNVLNWVTATETNNDYFLLEHSVDGINFTQVQKIKGSGSSSSIKTYEAFDYNPYDITYYRLTQYDFNGDHESFNIIAVSRAINKDTIKIYPNPTNGTLIVETPQQATKVEFRFYTTNGALVKPNQISKNYGSMYAINFNEDQLPSLLIINVDGILYAEKIVVTK